MVKDTVLGHTTNALLSLFEIMDMYGSETVEYESAENAATRLFWIICMGFGVKEDEREDCVDELWDAYLDWESEFLLYDRLLSVLQDYATLEVS